MAAPPTVVCGVTIDDSPAGAVMYDLTHPDSIVVAQRAETGVLVRVSPDCATGSDLNIDPPASILADSVVRAADGKMVVARLHWDASTKYGEGTASRAGRKLGTLAITGMTT